MGTGCGQGHGPANGNGNGNGGNLAFTRFLFVIARSDDEAHGVRLRTVAGNLSRGFFNDFDIDDTREMQAPGFETIQFYVRDGDGPAPESCQNPCLQKARHLVQVSSKYRPRLLEVDEELRRRIGDSVEILALDGAFRNSRYSSPEMVQYSNQDVPTRRSGRLSRNAIVVPMRKTPEWWQKSALERHSYFYPHVDHMSASAGKGTRDGGGEGDRIAVPPRLSQSRRLRAARRVRLRHVFRMRRSSHCRCSIRSSTRCATLTRIPSGATWKKDRSGEAEGCFAGSWRLTVLPVGS